MERPDLESLVNEPNKPLFNFARKLQLYKGELKVKVDCDKPMWLPKSKAHTKRK